MKIETYMNRVSNTFAENRILKFFVLVIGVTVFWNTIQIEKALNAQRTILIPPVMTTRLEISGETASDRTIDAYARYVISLIGNFTPATARRQFDSLLTLFTPESFQRSKILLYDLADRIETTQVTNAFFIQQILVTQARIEVRGLNKQFSETASLGEMKRTYLVDYKIINGRFSLIDISEKRL